MKSVWVEKAEKQGPCFICGPLTLARHRLWDAVDTAWRVDHLSVRQIMREYAMRSAAEVRWVIAAYAAARRAHALLPGRRSIP